MPLIRALRVAAALSPLPLAGWTGPAAAQTGDIAQGAYECWAFNRPRLTFNFTITGRGRYKDFEDKPGTYGFDPGSRRITFRGGDLDGQQPIYEVRKSIPTVSFVSERGVEAAFCEAVRR